MHRIVKDVAHRDKVDDVGDKATLGARGVDEIGVWEREPHHKRNDEHLAANKYVLHRATFFGAIQTSRAHRHGGEEALPKAQKDHALDDDKLE